MDVLGNLKARTTAFASVVMSMSTILLCYGLAVYYKHVPVWLPMISDCAVEAPEKYPFRLGMITSANLIALNCWIIYCLLKSKGKGQRYDTIALVLSLISSLGLATVGAVNEVEDTHLHGGAAGVFFVGYLIYEIFILLRLYVNKDEFSTFMNVTQVSLWSKLVGAIVLFCSLITLVYYSTLGWGAHQTQIAVCEWLSVFFIQLYNVSFAVDFGSDLTLSTLLAPSAEENRNRLNRRHSQPERARLMRFGGDDVYCDEPLL